LISIFRAIEIKQCRHSGRDKLPYPFTQSAGTH
jgi:hypothetical protein